jgi:hypothetical protein
MEMVRHSFPSQKFKDKPFVLMPIGDIQWAGKGGSTVLSLLKRRIEVGMNLGAYFIGLGDYIDAFSPSNRQRLRSAALYDTAMSVIDNAADALVQEIYDVALKPTKGRWLGLLAGHHLHEFATGDTSDQRLCRLLGAPFLGNSAYVGLDFVRKTRHNFVNVWASHGCGGGQRVSAPVTKLESISPSWEADVFITGHMTKLASAPLNRVYPVWGTNHAHLEHKAIQLVGAGGFSLGYELGSKLGNVPTGSYVEKGMMRPTALGSPIIRIQPKRNRSTTDERLKFEITVEL